MDHKILSPYTPTDPVTKPEHLVGRSEEIQLLLANVLSGRNTLVTGERGVGKTSLLSVLATVLKNHAYDAKRLFCMSVPSGSIVAFTTCSPECTVDSVADSLLRSLSRSTGIELSGVKKSSWTITAKAPILEAVNQKEKIGVRSSFLTV